jgi:competence protein ComEA
VTFNPTLSISLANEEQRVPGGKGREGADGCELTTDSYKSMIRSLLIKLAMLAGTAALVFWIGWPVPEPREDAPRVIADNPVEPVDRHETPGTHAAVVAPVPGSSRVDTPKVQAGSPVAKPKSRLDLNRASAEDLQRLPGIGEVLAKRVVEARTSKGSFTAIEELLEVKGIGEKKLERLRPLITVNASVRPPSGKAKL